MQSYLCIGIVAKPQGVKGELKIVPYTDDISRFALLKRVFVKKGEEYVPYQVLSSRYNDSFAFIRLEGVTDMNMAERLRDEAIYVARQDAAKLPEGRYYIADLIGCEVITSDNERLGKVEDILQNAGNDVYVVKGRRAVLFPAIKDLLLKIDVEAGVICVDAKRLSEVAVYED